MQKLTRKATRAEYLANMQVGNIVAFTNGLGMYSGMVVELVGEYATIQTPNGSIFYVNKENIKWVKNGSLWPVGIYNALRRTKNTTNTSRKEA